MFLLNKNILTQIKPSKFSVCFSSLLKSHFFNKKASDKIAHSHTVKTLLVCDFSSIHIIQTRIYTVRYNFFPQAITPHPNSHISTSNTHTTQTLTHKHNHYTGQAQYFSTTVHICINIVHLFVCSLKYSLFICFLLLFIQIR